MNSCAVFDNIYSSQNYLFLIYLNLYPFSNMSPSNKKNMYITLSVLAIVVSVSAFVYVILTEEEYNFAVLLLINPLPVIAIAIRTIRSFSKKD